MVLAAVALWHSALGAREHARRHAAHLCARARLQLLDQSVSLRRFRLRHEPDHGWQVQRDYAFDVSSTGHDRLPATLRMSGYRLIAWSLPGNAT